MLTKVWQPITKIYNHPFTSHIFTLILTCLSYFVSLGAFGMLLATLIIWVVVDFYTYKYPAKKVSDIIPIERVLKWDVVKLSLIYLVGGLLLIPTFHLNSLMLGFISACFMHGGFLSFTLAIIARNPKNQETETDSELE